MNNHNLTSPHGALCHDGVHKSIILLVCMLLMISCTGSDEPVISPDVISYQVETEGSHTRGAQATTSALASGFGVSAAVYPTAGTYTGYGCGSFFYNVSARPNTATGYYWPPADKKASFYAYYPYGNAALTLQSTANTLGVPTYAYTVPEAVASQVDVMTAQVTDHACGPQDALALTFGHRCSDIRFSVHNQSHLDMTLKSISIYGVKYSGTLTGNIWTLTGSANSSSSHPFTLTLNRTITAGATVDVTGTSNHFFMIPQTIASGTALFVIKTMEYGAERTYTHTLSSNYTWEAGNAYTYSLTLGDGEMIVYGDVTVSNWSN